MNQVRNSLIHNVLVLCNNTIVNLRDQITNLEERINVCYSRIMFLIEYRDNVVEDEERKETVNEDLEILYTERIELVVRAHELRGQMIQVYRFRDRRIIEIQRMFLNQNEQ